MTAGLELSRPLPAERIGRSGNVTVVEASEAECVAVAARLLIPGVRSLQCRWQLRLGENGLIAAEGALQAQVTQTCVVSLEPFESTLIESFNVYFVLEGRLSGSDDPEEPDELVYDGVTLELGEATVEQLALALDPYPRSPTAELPAMPDDGENGGFAALAKWRDLN
jgi:Large ribosomal RNA subunit accumulation protein YceD